ncbi:hypothetical protein ES332_A10G095500v1 [Gossypium tomentosum]|uniref:Uncharacterized protein n=1 Tax=Gossypium tomentosum TaxID=34277 RepID=A0A5D2NNQ4_GOSTO|nr:hypothetical protein ES332_A10G095500v1 [Gossypium tomentosum]
MLFYSFYLMKSYIQFLAYKNFLFLLFFPFWVLSFDLNTLLFAVKYVLSHRFQGFFKG